MRKRSIAVALGVLIVLWAVPASAQVVAETCRRDPADPPDEVLEIDATGETVTFDGCFLVEDYVTSTPILMTVDWVTSGGATCSFVGPVTLRGNGYTPRFSTSGSEPMGVTPGEDFVTFQVAVDALKAAGKRLRAMGHYAIPLDCVVGIETIPVSLGVNLRVTQPR